MNTSVGVPPANSEFGAVRCFQETACAHIHNKLRRHPELQTSCMRLQSAPMYERRSSAALHSHPSVTVCSSVCTPCYRAPEVVIARGRYNAAMDMWSLGCIFGELLQRTARPGTSLNTRLRIGPVFQLSCDTPPTPMGSETFTEDTHSLAQRVRCLLVVCCTYAACSLHVHQSARTGTGMAARHWPACERVWCRPSLQATPLKLTHRSDDTPLAPLHCLRRVLRWPLGWRTAPALLLCWRPPHRSQLCSGSRSCAGPDRLSRVYRSCTPSST